MAEELGGSGVIAVVTTGLILGNFGSRIGMNPRIRLVVSEFWEFVAFFVNSIVFLLIGDQVQFAGLRDNLGTIGVAIAILFLCRAISTFGLSALSNVLFGSEITWRGQTILWWGGLRGSVSVALALSVPINLAEREDIIAIVFGVMLFTPLVQGLTTQPLLNRLGLLGGQAVIKEYQQRTAHRVALSRVVERLREIKGSEAIDPEFAGYQMALVEGQLEEVREKMQRLEQRHDEVRQASRRTAAGGTAGD